MPDYELAREHLAEALFENGQVDRSLKIYDSVLKDSRNPEVIGVVASIYRKLGKHLRADELKQRANKRFKNLLNEFPEAMYSHAVGFYLEEGNNPKLALELTRKNIKLRPNSQSYQMLARAQLANNLIEEAEKAMELAMAMPVKSDDLLELYNEVKRQAKLADGAFE